MSISKDDLVLFAGLAAQYPGLRKFLQARLDRYVIQMIQAPDDLVAGKARGRAAELLELIGYLDTSGDLLQK